MKNKGCLAGCLLAPFRLMWFVVQFLWYGVQWCFQNGIKGFVVFGVGVLILAMIFGGTRAGCSRGSHNADVTAPTSGLQLPSKTDAPYYVQESNGVSYFMQKYHWQDTSLLIIENYWQLQGGKWTFHDNQALALSGKDNPAVVTR